jgi:hypothetical protein
MKTKFKAEIESAITEVFNRHAEGMEDDPWDYLIHPKLISQMTNAAEVVFDAAQDSQEYYESESV